MSIEDIVTLGGILFDAIQLSALGLDYEKLFFQLYVIATFTAGDFSWLYPWNYESMWKTALSGCCISLFCTVVLLIVLCKFDDVLHNRGVVSNLYMFTHFVCPLLLKFGFLPFISVTFQMFRCRDTDSEVVNSVNELDCSHFCWKDQELFYRITLMSFLSITLPIYCFYCQIWKDIQIKQHCKIDSRFSQAKLVFLTWLIIQHHLFSPYSQITKFVMFNISIGCYLFTNFKMYTYNYKRARLWNIICIIGAAVPSFWVFIDENILNDTSFSSIMMVVNIVILFVIGGLLQARFAKSYLHSKHFNRLEDLFRFQMSKAAPDQANIKKKYLDLVQSNDAKTGRVLPDVEI